MSWRTAPALSIKKGLCRMYLLLVESCNCTLSSDSSTRLPIFLFSSLYTVKQHLITPFFPSPSHPPAPAPSQTHPRTARREEERRNHVHGLPKFSKR
jgi:hypothetical protein